MAPNVSQAANHLIRYLQSRREAGQERAYLTEDAKACLRELYFRARQARTRSRSAASPAPSVSNVPAESPDAPSAPLSQAATAASAPAQASAQAQEPAYPKAPVAEPRKVLTLQGETRESQLADLKQRLTQDSEAHPPTLRDTSVFSVGNLNAELMIVGEAPGHEEERQQEPFVGPAGQLLTKIIQAMGLQRESIYISNIVKYRPAIADMEPRGQGTSNRKPTTQEMQACLPYIMAEISLVKPKVIVAAGATAAEGLMGKSAPVRQLRGQVRSWNGIPFVVTYHPSYLLHNKALSERRKVWEDMLLVMEVLHMPISEKQRRFFSKGN